MWLLTNTDLPQISNPFRAMPKVKLSPRWRQTEGIGVLAIADAYCGAQRYDATGNVFEKEPDMQANAQSTAVNAQLLIQKIQSLPPERVAEVYDFVEFLQLQMQKSQAQTHDRTLTGATSRASEPSFAKVWDNAEDEAYDAL